MKSLVDQPLAALWASAEGPSSALDWVSLPNQQRVLPSSFAVDLLAQTSIAAAALAAAELWHHRTGRRQAVEVDRRHAAIEFRSERYLRTTTPPVDPWDKIAGLYRGRDNRWLRLHTNFPHHRDGVLALLNCAYDREAVQAALAERDVVAFETEAAARGLVVTATRTRAQWMACAAGQAVATLPVLTIERIGAAPPQPFPAAPTRPLSHLRVLDLTRIIAGPVAARTLAAHGADVLHVTSPKLPSIPLLVMDTGRGKRTTALDLDEPEDRARLLALVRDADVFLQGYRPGGLAARGFDPSALAAARPGLVYAALSAYGHRGPWAERRGFDSLTQNANGLNVAEAQALSGSAAWERPKELPAQALDHGAGHLLAFGIQMALLRRATIGGSWLVRTSLAQVGEWLWSLPRVADGLATPDPTPEAVQDLLEVTPTAFGPLTAVRHAARLSETPARYAQAAMPLGSGPAAWL
jgi:crotonobetainyl-CoA:carnitine CoA-transferase CaiB-like acyl-CoA transferase